MASASATRMVVESVPDDGREASRPRVLLVDDNLINQRLAARSLERCGCEVEVAGGGREALALWGRHSYELILMDCQMPDMDGYEATRAIRDGERDTGRSAVPIVALTAHAMPGDREECLRRGMDDHLGKPVSPEALAAVVRRWVAA